MRRKPIQVILLSLLLSGSAVAISNYSQEVKSPAKEAAEETVEPYGIPGKVTNLKAVASTPNEDGAADVTITFTTPTEYFDEEEYEYIDGLNELTKIVITEQTGDYWDGYEYEELATIETPGIGVDLEYVIENAASGQHTYAVFALNSASKTNLSSNSRSKQSVTVKVGYEAPSTVENLSYKNNYPEIVLTWDAPTKGKNGGAFRAEGITYTVTRYTGKNLTNDEEIATGLTETTFTDNFEVSELTQVQYGVYATNADGNSSEVYTTSFIVGPAYELPFTESFTNGSATKLWTKYSSLGSYGTMSAATYISSYGLKTGLGATLYNSYDEDGGALYIKQNNTYYDPDDEEEDAYITYTSSAISLKGASNPSLSFYQYIAASTSNKLTTSIIIEQGGVQTVVKTYTYEEGTEGWQPDAISLKQFVGDEPIVLIFRGDCKTSQAGFTAFDVLKIDEVLDNDLSAVAITAPAQVDAGNTIEASVEVRNNGENDAKDFSVELYLNDELIDSQAVAELASGESTNVSFSFVAKNSFGSEATLTAKIVFDADEAESNNVAEATVAIRQAAVPAATDLKAEVVNGNVELSWTAPDYELPATETTTESFESYANGSQSFGSWTTSALHSTSVDFTDYGLDEADWQDKNAYTVLDNEALGLDEENSWYGEGHTGTHYLMSSAGYWSTRTDWLISPELSGAAQTISFYAASRHQPTDSWWDSTYDEVSVYYSTTTNDKSAFAGNVALESQQIKNFLKKGDGYAEFTAELPEGAKYFAIIVTTPDESEDSIVFIDDITYEGAQTGVAVTLLGYDIYDGATKVNSELITEESAVLKDVSAGVHNYSVVAVYNAGESEASEAVELDTTTSGVKDLSASGVRVYTTQGQIHIEAQAAQVFDLAGRKIAQTVGNATVNVVRGTYVVKANAKVFKVIVK